MKVSFMQTTFPGIKKCCLTCQHANRKSLHPHAASFQVICENPDSYENGFVHLARDFCSDKLYSQISIQDLLKDLGDILTHHYGKFDMVIGATKSVIEGKPFKVDNKTLEGNALEYTIAELEDIKNGFWRSLDLLRFFLAECLLTQDQKPEA